MGTLKAQASENGLMVTSLRDSTSKGFRLGKVCLFVNRGVGATLVNGNKEKCAALAPVGGQMEQCTEVSGEIVLKRDRERSTMLMAAFWLAILLLTIQTVKGPRLFRTAVATTENLKTGCFMGKANIGNQNFRLNMKACGAKMK